MLIIIVDLYLREASKFACTSSGLWTVTDCIPYIAVIQTCIVCPKLWNNGRFACRRVSEFIRPIFHICTQFAIMLRWVSTAAFGMPSEPLVNIIDASLSPPSRGIPYMRDNTQNGSRRTATSFAAMRFLPISFKISPMSKKLSVHG